MRNALVCAVLMALSLNSMAQGTPPAQVEVRFDHPEKFRDASPATACTRKKPCSMTGSASGSARIRRPETTLCWYRRV
ncbi:hypothetical protein N8H41_05485 [Pseudomonas vlassakiae]|nr:hypothetical protein [Pseudomonas sp. NBRC 111130]MCU0123425.1 hypothetical protein [Pseudomonas vlassakiae]